MIKSPKYLLPAEKIKMGGLNVKQALPTENLSHLDPFLLIHHAKTQYSALSPARHQGVDPHPHRGFSPITIVVAGEVRHRDSHGNDQIAKQGEIQWLHAGAGIIHSERPSEYLLKNGGYQEIIQIWINSPKKNKMDRPSYLHYRHEDFKVKKSRDGLVTSRSIINLDRSPVEIIWVKGNKSGIMDFDIKENYSTSIYVISGSINVKGFGKVESEHLLVLGEEGCQIITSCLTVCNFLILAGEPLKEKVIQSGPYVMNSETEILEAIRDYQIGKMGILIEDF